jgi:hypothetical protein
MLYALAAARVGMTAGSEAMCSKLTVILCLLVVILSQNGFRSVDSACVGSAGSWPFGQIVTEDSQIWKTRQYTFSRKKDWLQKIKNPGLFFLFRGFAYIFSKENRF